VARLFATNEIVEFEVMNGRIEFAVRMGSLAKNGC
jgi:hypothetical protein